MEINFQRANILIRGTFILLLLYLFTAIPASANINEGLIGHWNFNEMVGTTARDSSGYGRNGTLTNSPTWINGKLDGALSFTQAGNTYVAVPDSDDSKYTGAITLAAWVYFIGGSQNLSIMSKNSGNGATANPFDFRTNAGTNLVLVRANTTYKIFNSSTAVSTDGWHHVAVTSSNGDVATPPLFYIDGVLVGTTDGGSGGTGIATGSGHDIWIGRRDDGIVEMDGYIDDARIYNRALSAADIAQLYNFRSATLRRPVNNLGLVAYYSFDEGVGTMVGDLSGNGHNATLANSPTWVSGKRSRAVSFSEISHYASLPNSVLGSVSGGTEITVSTWFKGSNFESAVRLQPTASDYIVLGWGTPRKAIISTDGGTGGVNLSEVSDDRWHHVAMTWKKNTTNGFKVYVDGIVVNQRDSANVNLPVFSTLTYPPLFGRYGGTGSENMIGTLDETRIYSRELTAAEIKGLYSQGAAIVGGGEVSKVTGGLMAYWPFNGKDMIWSSGTWGTAYDRSGNGKLGTLNSMNQLSSPSPGVLGQSLYFDGVNDYISAGTLDATSAVTVSVWVYLDQGGTDQKIAGNQNGSAGGYKLGLFTTNKPEFEIRNATNIGISNRAESGGTALALNRWYHVVGVFDDSADYLATYVNGVLDRSMTTTESLTASGNFVIGKEPFGSILYFKGKLDDMRVYNKRLSDSEIKQLYQMGSRVAN